MIYRIALQGRLAQEAVVEVEADSDEEARSLAEDRAMDGLVNWFDVNNELHVEIESK